MGGVVSVSELGGVLSLDGGEATGGSLGVAEVVIGVAPESTSELSVEVTLPESDEGVESDGVGSDEVGAGEVEVSLDGVFETVCVSAGGVSEIVTTTVSELDVVVSVEGVDVELEVSDAVPEVVVSTVGVSADPVSDEETVATTVSVV